MVAKKRKETVDNCGWELFEKKERMINIIETHNADARNGVSAAMEYANMQIFLDSRLIRNVFLGTYRDPKMVILRSVRRKIFEKKRLRIGNSFGTFLVPLQSQI